MEGARGSFLFATGMECSYPTIEGPGGRTIRVDELERSFHYRHWQEDLALVRDLGLTYLRYGPPYYRVHTAPDTFDWEFSDDVFAEMRRLGIIPIVDLCHFGVPDWAGSFQNPDWPELFARYASAFARRFPWVRFYTPVNEISVCARFSGLFGLWNERLRDDRAFVTALNHLCRANLLAVQAILAHRPDAVFLQSESAEYFHPAGGDRDCTERARFENERRFVSLDLLTGRQPSADIALYLLDNGMTREELRAFLSHGLGDYMVIGSDFYERNEQIVEPGGEMKPAGDVFGWATITREYYERYRRPVMLSETNNIQGTVDPVRWFWKLWFNVRYLRQEGVPVVGFTWYSLLDQVDWDSGLALDRGVVNPVGLYDLQRKPRPVAEAYRALLRQAGEQPLYPASRPLGFSERVPTDEAPLSLAREFLPPPLQRTRPHPWHTVEGRGPLPDRARVAVSRTADESVDEEGVLRLVREALAHLGGMERFVGAGQTVLIKPNQTIWRTADTGATTDPRVVAALARLAREAGAGIVQVGECSSCGQVTREVMVITGMERAAREAGAEPVFFDECEQVEVEIPAGRRLTRVPIPRPLLEADVVVACPKLKTHFLDPVTGAVKLWVGAARQDTMHRLHRDSVQETVADLLTVTRPDLCVMDAVIAGEGDGPVAVRGRFVGCILASDDPAALDVIAAELAGFDGETMSFPRAAAEQGVGRCERTRIDVLGVPLAEARTPLERTNVNGWDRYPVRVIAGEGVTLAGTLGHFKGFADLWLADRVWDAIVALKGVPTFLIGRAEDPGFEEHVKEGRYFVLDDVALDKYKRDPRVTFIPGSPIGNEMMPVIMKALGVDLPGRAAQEMVKAWNALRARWRY